MKKLTLEEVIEGIEEPRRQRSIIYPLDEVLIIMLLAVIYGATSYAKVEMFGKSKKEWLGKFLKLENGVPDADTFRKVMMKIDSSQLHKVFKAIPHNHCAQDAQSDFSSDCLNSTQEG